MSYKLIIHKGAEKEINKLHTQTGERVIKKIFELRDSPRPNGSIKMTNYTSTRLPGKECHRIRVGDIRVIYAIEDQIVTVTVVKVEKRGDIY